LAAEVLGRQLAGGDVVGLVGGLGTGKTCFTQGLARGLDVDSRSYVRSPTFALVNTHQGRVDLYHVDLYRLSDPEESVFMGYEDLFDGQAVVAIEWFDRFEELWPASYLELTFEALEGDGREGDGRRITARAQGSRPARILERWRDAWEGGVGDRP
jgi:tRNA threonylcarbamoyladenosine biosynthesis protein TsaE